MRRVLPYVALLLAYLMTPSSGEITENLVHLLTEGHTAHALHDDAHRRDGAEHGCSGPFHVCFCHSSTAFTVPGVTADLGAPTLRETDVAWVREDAPAEGFAMSVFRPPIALEIPSPRIDSGRA